MDSQQDIVLLFTRYPAPGRSKTRLIPALGAYGAAELQKRMTERTLTEILRLAPMHPYDIEIRYDGTTETLMRAWLGPHAYRRQTGADLGARMADALRDHLGKRTAIVLTGSDCPGLTSRILAEALRTLRQKDIVIGPACDGGYYLIGINGALSPATVSSLFTGIPWGTNTVFQDTMAQTAAVELSVHLLPQLHDIDRPEDLGYLHHHSDTE